MSSSFLSYLDSLNQEIEPDEVNNFNQTPVKNFSNDIPNEYEQSFKKGGRVRKRNLRSLVETIRKQGRNGDTVLAHINPMEALALKEAGGSGTINPKTGAPEFFFRGVRNFAKNPGKTINKTLKNPSRTIADTIGTAGAIFGGPVGGALAGAARSAIRKENPLLGLLTGAGYGYALPQVAGFVAPHFANMGAEGIGQSLAEYGNSGKGAFGSLSSLFNQNGKIGMGVSAGDELPLTRENLERYSANDLNEMLLKREAIDKLVPKTFSEKAQEYLTKPETLLTLGATGLSAYNANQLAKEAKKERQENRVDKELNREILRNTLKKEREKSPEEEADYKRRYARAMQLSPEELEANNRYLKLLMGTSDVDLINELPMKQKYRKQHTPEEYAKTGKWFSYYDNPEFTGAPEFKEGGTVDSIYETTRQPTIKKTIIKIITPNHKEELTNILPHIFSMLKSPLDAMFHQPLKEISDSANGQYIEGDSGGQDDNIDAKLSPGEYVIDASTVSDLGDGNNVNGAKKLDEFVKVVRKHKRGGRLKLPPKAKNITEYAKI